MDPITTIVTAVTAGAVAATKETVGQAVKDGYAGFKALLLRKFGEKTDLQGALQGVEKKPDSDARKAVLKEELEAAGAGQDGEVVRQAQALLDLLKAHGLEPGTSYHAEVHGSGAIAQGPGAVAAGERGVAIGGGVSGSVIVTGDQNTVVKED
ncbi:MAG: hypothetical protein D6759_02260 [Chloroflexi bacterium]|nr:MAG: hypothetical protein D6759_02260 [Chloroflexota bacterium]